MEKIRFLPEPADGFYNTLRRRVRTYFKQNDISQYSNAQAVLKAFLFASLFVSSYLIIILTHLQVWGFLLSWFSMGVFLILTAMSIVHDSPIKQTWLLNQTPCACRQIQEIFARMEEVKSNRAKQAYRRNKMLS